MKFFVSILILCISFISFGQEKTIHKIDWEELGADIEHLDVKYAINYFEIIPSLSFINNNNNQNNHTLMVVDLSVDLRTQNLRSKTPTLQLPENKFVKSDYSFELPSKKKNKSAFRFTSNGNNNGGNNSGTNKELINTAYKDMGVIPIYYCPVTNAPILINQ